MLDKRVLATDATSRLVYIALMATTRRPYVDRSPFLLSSLSTLTGLTPFTVKEALLALEESGLLVRGTRQYSDAYYLPSAMAFDNSLSPRNPNHRLAVQKRLSKIRAYAPELCDQFLADNPKWLPKHSTKETPDELESTAGRRAESDQ